MIQLRASCFLLFRGQMAGAQRGEGKSATPCAGAEITAAATRAHAGGRWLVPLSDARHALADLIAAARHAPLPEVANLNTVRLLCFGRYENKSPTRCSLSMMHVFMMKWWRRDDRRKWWRRDEVYKCFSSEKTLETGDTRNAIYYTGEVVTQVSVMSRKSM
ncbi:hypothetical protein OPV22_006085 [Ensete ventricosum]|uniref:Uncharacterized protein n=1 Tax=Ensete ventricosum TaxID=4639 RepID=A0AAV8RNY5_ENSVE|nr:hypothetical protein OPV22_006085 [Ensete ventricosum]